MEGKGYLREYTIRSNLGREFVGYCENRRHVASIRDKFQAEAEEGTRRGIRRTVAEAPSYLRGLTSIEICNLFAYNYR